MMMKSEHTQKWPEALEVYLLRAFIGMQALFGQLRVQVQSY